MALRDQLTLSLFDDTSLLGLTADVPAAAAQSVLDTLTLDEPPELLPVDYRLVGERRLAATWCLRAADNLAAIERLGARKDGVIRHHALRRDGTVRDTVMYSMTDGEWPEAKAQLLYLRARRG